VTKPRYTSLARLDLVEALQYYDCHSQHAGDDFLTEIERTAWLLAGDPEIGEVFVEGVREFPIRDFPYTMYYELVEQRVRIIAVLHQSRDIRPVLLPRIR
jgi:plasmid stabilization system protein ParE